MKKNNTPRLRRSESFLGIHFDFHAQGSDQNVGANVTRRMVEDIIDQVKPDYIQCDNKGHPGFSSYPTEVGHSPKGMIGDPLRIWRDVTARRGVALFMHHSGVWDTEAIRQHPSWARINADGKRDKNGTSVFSAYVDKLLIPQLKELSDKYDVDGVWVDGECWAAGLDYAPYILKAFQTATGIRTVPRKKTDPHYEVFAEFCREGFRKYMRRYTDAIHAHNPQFQIAGNWAFSSYMPEPVSVEVDFLSGDYTHIDSVNSARLEGRALQHQGKPWDLMAWAFSGSHSTKSIPQLQREAAVVLALGGGFQAYFNQHRDGSVMDWQMKLMAGVAKFCRARQKFCHRAQPVPQIGLILSNEGNYRASQSLFNPWSQQLVPMQGTLNCLLESQHSVEVLMTHHVLAGAKQYPILILPEWETIESKLRKVLLEYVRNGGTLLITGPKAAAHFKKELKVKLTGEATSKHRWIAHEGWLGGIETVTQTASVARGVRTFGKLYEKDDFIGDQSIAASITKYGKGRIAATYFNLGERYRKASTSTARRFLDALVCDLFPEPLVEVKGSQYVDVSVNRLEGKLIINLVNTSGPHADNQVYVHDEITPLGPLTLSIRCRNKPKQIMLQPANKPLRFLHQKGVATVVLPRLEIHDIITIL